MFAKTLVSTAIALALCFSGPSFAQGRDDRPGQHRGPQAQRGGPPQQHDARNQHDERGAGPKHSFHRGDRLPARNHARRYVVNDWQARHLSAPPRGYHWVRTGSDYVLVAIATGVILELLLSR